MRGLAIGPATRSWACRVPSRPVPGAKVSTSDSGRPARSSLQIAVCRIEHALNRKPAAAQAQGRGIDPDLRAGDAKPRRRVQGHRDSLVTTFETRERDADLFAQRARPWPRGWRRCWRPRPAARRRSRSAGRPSPWPLSRPMSAAPRKAAGRDPGVGRRRAHGIVDRGVDLQRARGNAAASKTGAAHARLQPCRGKLRIGASPRPRSSRRGRCPAARRHPAAARPSTGRCPIVRSRVIARSATASTALAQWPSKLGTTMPPAASRSKRPASDKGWPATSPFAVRLPPAEPSGRSSMVEDDGGVAGKSGMKRGEPPQLDQKIELAGLAFAAAGQAERGGIARHAHVGQRPRLVAAQGGLARQRHFARDQGRAARRARRHRPRCPASRTSGLRHRAAPTGRDGRVRRAAAGPAPRTAPGWAARPSP